MTITSRARNVVAVAATAFAVLFLVNAEARAANAVPPLTSTPQYKAFAQFVAQLNGMRSTPATPQRKAELEQTLSTRYQAVVSRSKALLERAKAIAKRQVLARYKAEVTRVRNTEAQELTEIRQDAATRLQRALTAYNRGIATVDRYYDNVGARLRKALKGARARLAKATNPVIQQQLRIRIDSLVKQLNDNNKDQQRDLSRLRTRYLKEKQAIEATRAQEAERVITTDQAMIESLRRHRERSYRLRVGTLQAKRQTQLAMLEDKLDAGRLSISLMPTVTT